MRGEVWGRGETVRDRRQREKEREKKRQ